MIYVSSPVLSTVKGQTLPLSSCACFRDLMFLCVSMRLYEEADTSKHLPQRDFHVPLPYDSCDMLVNPPG